MRRVSLKEPLEKICIAQLNPTVGDFESNEKKLVSIIGQAEEKGCDLVIFSVLPCSGSPLFDLARQERFVHKGVQTAKAAARATRRKNVAALVSFIEKHQGNFAFTIALVRRGVITPVWRRALSSDVPIKKHVFRLARTRAAVGLFAANDNLTSIRKRFRVYKRSGAKLIIMLSEIPYCAGEVTQREHLFRRVSNELDIFVLFVSQVGGQDELIFDGRSFVTDPAGSAFARGPAFEEKLIDVSLNSKVARYRGVAAQAHDEIKDVYDALVLGVRDYVRKNGFEKVVVGVSGGIDSALTTVIACDALGHRNVTAVAMSGPFSSPSSTDDAKALARELNIEFKEYPIGQMYEGILGQLAGGANKKRSVTVSMENLQARLRGVMLMYMSNERRALVLATGNKSEAAMGYCTLYGDTCGALCVLGDVYKTDVYKLAYYRNSIENVIPTSIIDKAPSAELRPGQKDEDALPPYDILDEILKLYLDRGKSASQIVKTLRGKVDSSVVNDVLYRVDYSEYKRKQSPPLLSVTRFGWMKRHIPITNRFR